MRTATKALFGALVGGAFLKIWCSVALGEPLGVGCLAVASFPQPILGALPPPCRFFDGVVVLVVGVVVLVGGVVPVAGVVLVLVVLRNGVLKVLGAAPLASFCVDPATRAES